VKVATPSLQVEVLVLDLAECGPELVEEKKVESIWWTICTFFVHAAFYIYDNTTRRSVEFNMQATYTSMDALNEET
jgi:hypothetical protein